VRFAPESNALADMVWKDVLAGIRSLVSVGYLVNEWQRCNTDDDEDKDKEKLASESGEAKKAKTPIWRAKRWSPMEISIVAIPADYKQSGIGREQEVGATPPPAEPQAEQPAVPVAEKNISVQTRGIKMTEAEISAAEKERLILAEKQAREKASKEAQQECEREALIRKQEDARVKEIYALTEKFSPALRERAMTEGWSVDQVRAEILGNMDKPQTVARFQQESMTDSSGMSIGEIFVRSPQFQRLAPSMGGHKIQDKVVVDIPRVGFGPSLQRAITLSAGGASGQLTSYLTSTQALPGVPGLLDQQQLRIAQMFPTGTTSARRITWVKEDAFVNSATGVREEATKPQWDPNISETYVDVMKVGVFCKVTEEMLADQDGIRSYLDNRLAYLVMAHEDDDLINGTAAAYEVTGVLQTSGIQTLAAGTYSTVMDAIGQAIGKIRSLAFAEPDGIIVNSNDWTDLILSKDQNGQFYAGGPFMNQYGQGQFTNVFRMFGIPVVVSSFIAEGTALVGAFRTGSQLFRREGVRVEATNTNDTDFIFNLITIRAESRMALAVYKPLCFCSVTGIA